MAANPVIRIWLLHYPQRNKLSSVLFFYNRKIITWNCNMAFRKKAGLILSYQPDILVIPECEHPDKLKFMEGIPEPTDILWFGTNVNKGLGIFSYSNFRFNYIRLITLR